MCFGFDPFRLLLISISGWISQQQRDVIDYLQEENRVLRQQLGGKRLRLSDDQRRRLAVKAKKLARRILREVATIVTPETLLAWLWFAKNASRANTQVFHIDSERFSRDGGRCGAT